MGYLPWEERIHAISVNPHMANINDISNMAADLTDFRELARDILGCCGGQDYIVVGKPIVDKLAECLKWEPTTGGDEDGR